MSTKARPVQGHYDREFGTKGFAHDGSISGILSVSVIQADESDELTFNLPFLITGRGK